MTLRLILLDRDGVINQDSSDYIKSPKEWQPIPGSLEAIARLTGAGLKVGVCTNQSGIGRGLFSEDSLTRIHEKMCRLVTSIGGRIDTLHYCPHHPDDNCACRKPQPGMLTDAMTRLNINAADTVFVGDSERDVGAALAARCDPVIVRTGNGSATAARLPDIEAHPDLAGFVQWLLEP